MNPFPTVSVVIVSWKVKRYLLNCLKSIYASDYPGKIEIIVVDNNSKDGTIEAISKTYPNVKLIASKENLGFARGNNLGFKEAKGDYIYILNPDTLIPKNNISILADYLTTHPDVGMTGPKVLFEDGSIQLTCARKFPNLKKAFFLDALRLSAIPKLGSWLNKKIRFPYDYGQEQEIEAGVGAALMIRSSLLKKIGGFCEDFLHGGEDNYLCFQVKEKGYKLMYLPSTSITHFTAESVKQANVRSTVNSILSNGIFFKLKCGALHFHLYKMIMRFIYVPLNFLLNDVKKYLNKIHSEEYSEQRAILLGIFQWNPIK